VTTVTTIIVIIGHISILELSRLSCSDQTLHRFQGTLALCFPLRLLMSGLIAFSGVKQVFE
jgi:hypothetical protein